MAASDQAVAKANEEVAPKIQLWKPSQHFNGEGSMTHRETTDAVGHSGGVVIDCMVTRTC